MSTQTEMFGSEKPVSEIEALKAQYGIETECHMRAEHPWEARAWFIGRNDEVQCCFLGETEEEAVRACVKAKVENANGTGEA